MMEVLRTIEELRAWRKARHGSIGFVPTMGYLHEGHEALMHEALRHADELVVSVYVNPTQFGPDEDLQSYPRDFEGDRRRCEAAGAHAMFFPSDEMMYGPGFASTVQVHGMSAHMCGEHRPGHFDGVTLVVTKLFNLVQPDVAVFGQKDYQQLAIIRRMVEDLNFPITIVGVPTVREVDGLAKSSRNRYLTGDLRQRATVLSRALRQAWRAWHDGERDTGALLATAQGVLDAEPGVTPDYVELIDADSLERHQGQITTGAVMALAVQVGPARLIDNLRLDAPLPEGLIK